MSPRRVIVVGGGAAGFFAAIHCAENAPGAEVAVLEKTAHFLAKVRISGGGRCNVTHACFDPRALSAAYPRGGPALIGAFQRFQPRDTVAWFEAHGVPLKREEDGRMFPVSDSSRTIVECLLAAARSAGVQMRVNHGVAGAVRRHHDGFELTLASGETLRCDSLLLATGGCRVPAMAQLAQSLGHSLEPPVPSLFTFHLETPWVRELPGVAVESVEVSVPGTGLKAQGPLLFTHTGMSGPAILRLSAWGARLLAGRHYRFPLQVNWLPSLGGPGIAEALNARRTSHGARLVVNVPLPPLTARLWERLVGASGIDRETRWSSLTSAARHRLETQLVRTELPVVGKSLNQEEFVTCGGVPLNEINFKTMESRLCPGLYLAGELLDIDGITGGFNFQAAWTTGWIAGEAMARPLEGTAKR
jgi:predicted Rossmann fold flavoprotein